jgi:hypothetical protein
LLTVDPSQHLRYVDAGGRPLRSAPGLLRGRATARLCGSTTWCVLLRACMCTCRVCVGVSRIQGGARGAGGGGWGVRGRECTVPLRRKRARLWLAFFSVQVVFGGFYESMRDSKWCVEWGVCGGCPLFSPPSPIFRCGGSPVARPLPCFRSRARRHLGACTNSWPFRPLLCVTHVLPCITWTPYLDDSLGRQAGSMTCTCSTSRRSRGRPLSSRLPL